MAHTPPVDSPAEMRGNALPALSIPRYPCAPTLDAHQTLMNLCHSPCCPPPITVITDAPLHASIVERFNAALPPLARRIIPVICAGCDLVSVVRFGMPDEAYLLPTLSRILLAPPSAAPPTSERTQPSLVILAPAREHAYVIHAHARDLCSATALRVGLLVGGISVAVQKRELDQGCDVVVGTPGRLLDFVSRRLVSLASVKCIVLVDADRLLDCGFREQLRDLFAKLPRAVQIVLNAGEFTEELQQFVDHHVQRNYRLIQTRPLTQKLL